jgi:Txe/YoeB family toxin of Txe-Axe toxin-antitoxin module
MRILEKVQIITKLKEKIEALQDSDKQAAEKLQKLLNKLTKTPDMGYV